MLVRTFDFEQVSIIAAVVCSLIVAGLLKGTIGVGIATAKRMRRDVRNANSDIQRLRKTGCRHVCLHPAAFY